MKIVTTRACVDLHDDSGYRFLIYVEGVAEPFTETERGFEPTSGRGWKAEVTLGHHHSGAASMNGVLAMVLTEARQLVRMLENELGTELTQGDTAHA